MLVEIDGPVAVVTLHRPEQRNALNVALRDALWRTMAQLDADDAVAAVVLTGTDPAFCAGLDLKEIASGALDVAQAVAPATREGRREPPSPLPSMRTPLIGAVNGVAVTGGLELALRCDFLIASERARFADTHARVGVQPGWGLTVHLAEAVGIRRAKEMSATGNYVDATTALSWGLVNHVVPHDRLLETALTIAGDIASSDRDGVARILETYVGVVERHRTDALLFESDAAGEWVASRRSLVGEVAQRRAEVVTRGRTQAHG